MIFKTECLHCFYFVHERVWLFYGLILFFVSTIPARMFDFFDAGTMEGLQYRLLRCTRWRLGGGCPLREPQMTRHIISLHATLTATRYNSATGGREALVSYYPPNV